MIINPFFKISFHLSKFFWKQASVVQRFIITLFVLLMFGVMLAVGWFSYLSFVFLKNNSANSQLGIYALYIGLTLLFMLFILGSAITTASLAYQSPDLPFFLSFPLTADSIISEKVLESIIISGWGVIALGAPALISFGMVVGGGVIYYLITLLCLVALCFLAGALGSVIVIFGNFFTRTLPPVAKKIVISCFVFIWLFAMALAVLPNVNRISQAAINGIAPNLSVFAGPISRFFPSYYLSELINWTIGGNQAILALVWLVIYFVIVWYALRIASTNYYWPGLQSVFQRLVTVRSKKTRDWFENQRYILERKEAIQIWRELRTGSQLIFVAILLTFYVLVLFVVSRADMSGHWGNFFFGALLVVAGYVVSTILLRFIFPMMSFEGQSGWLLWSCPVSLGRLLRAKWIVGLLFALLLGIVVGGISAAVLPFVTLMKLAFLLYAVLISIMIGILQLGIGMTYPNFHESDPNMLSNSGPGLAAIVLSLIVASLGAWFTYQDVSLIGHYGWLSLLLFHLISFLALIVVIGLIWIKKVYETAKSFTF